MGKRIVKIVNGWSRPIEWAGILDCLSRGEAFAIFNGKHPEIPYADGRVSLSIKVGKHRKLIPGRLETEADGWDDDGDNYLQVFYPNKRFPIG